MKSIKINGRKKLLLIGCLAALPCIALLLWAANGGWHKAQTPGLLPGLNMQLPGARLKNDSTEDKLSIYQQAEKDSLRFRQAQQDDPYYRSDTAHLYGSRTDSFHQYDSERMTNPTGIVSGSNYSIGSLSTSSAALRSNEQQITQKLALLNSQISQSHPAADADTNGTVSAKPEQLSARMQELSSAGSEDPQMAQLSDMLDKIQEIQNPGLAQQKLKAQSQQNRGQVFAVSATRKEDAVSTLDVATEQAAATANGFYSLEEHAAAAGQQNAIEAVVHNAQTVVTGSTVKLRLVNDVFINGVLIPKENFIFGLASLNGDRLEIKVTSIRYRHSIFPVDLSVYDMDGANGIYIPGAITRDVAKESADQGVQNLGLMTYNPSLGAQAASAGISAAKTLFSRKVRRIKVTVKAGYQVLLVDEKQKQNN